MNGDPARDLWSAETVDGDDGTTLVLRGELDASNASAVTERVEACAGEVVHLDLTGVTFMDSSGLAALIQAQRRLRTGGRRLAITETSEPVQRVLDLAGVAEHLGASGR